MSWVGTPDQFRCWEPQFDGPCVMWFKSFLSLYYTALDWWKSSPENCKLIVGLLQGRQNSLGAVLYSIFMLCWHESNPVKGDIENSNSLSARSLHQFSTKSAYSEISPPLLGNQKNPGAVFSQCVAMNKCPEAVFIWDILLCWHIRRSKDFWFNIGLIPY